MPELLITVSDADLKALDQVGDSIGLSTRRLAERIVHRGLAQQTGQPRQTNRVRATERARRQLLLTQLLESLAPGQKLTRERLQEFAKSHELHERTIYRDLEVAMGASGREAEFSIEV